MVNQIDVSGCGFIHVDVAEIHSKCGWEEQNEIFQKFRRHLTYLLTFQKSVGQEFF